MSKKILIYFGFTLKLLYSVIGWRNSGQVLNQWEEKKTDLSARAYFSVLEALFVS